MKYPCKLKFAPTLMNKIQEWFMFVMNMCMDIHEQASVAAVGASNKKIYVFKTLNFNRIFFIHMKPNRL